MLSFIALFYLMSTVKMFCAFFSSDFLLFIDLFYFQKLLKYNSYIIFESAIFNSKNLIQLNKWKVSY